MYSISIKNIFKSISLGILYLLFGILISFIFEFNKILLGVLTIWLSIYLLPLSYLYGQYYFQDKNKVIIKDADLFIVKRNERIVFKCQIEDLDVLKVQSKDMTLAALPWENTYFYFVVTCIKTSEKIIITSLMGNIFKNQLDIITKKEFFPSLTNITKIIKTLPPT